MQALVQSMRRDILGKMQGRLGHAPPLVVPQQGSYWGGVLREGNETRRGSKDTLLGAQVMQYVCCCSPRTQTQAKLESALRDDAPGGAVATDAADAPPSNGATPHKTPSKAHVAAFEIASNPAIRELAIAQSFLRAERHATPPKAEQSTPGRRSLSAGASPWRPNRGLGNRHDAADGFFVSTSALSASSREGKGTGEAALGRANSMLSGVLEGLRREVATARERRLAAEERCASLQQTSALLAVKLDRVMQELHDRRQTLTDLATKV